MSLLDELIVGEAQGDRRTELRRIEDSLLAIMDAATHAVHDPEPPPRRST